MIGERQTILVVDDTVENIDILRNLLSDMYSVKVALNGQKALDIAHKDAKIDLILLDIMMPDMDGYEVITQLKSDPKTQNIPVIFITALSETEDETKGFALGAADYITKPIKPAILQARVRTHLQLYQYGARLEEQNEKLQKTVRVLENKLARVFSCKKPGPATEGASKETVVPVDEYFLDDDKNDLEDMHEEIDSIIHMMLLQNRIDPNMLKKLGTLFMQYGSKLSIYPIFYRLGSGMTDFSNVLMAGDLDPQPDNIHFSLECLESLIYTLEHWYRQVFISRIGDVNVYDNSMLADMETVRLALRNELDSIENDVEFF